MTKAASSDSQERGAELPSDRTGREEGQAGALRARTPHHLPSICLSEENSQVHAALAALQADGEDGLAAVPCASSTLGAPPGCPLGPESPTSQNPRLGAANTVLRRALALSLPQPLTSGVTFVRHLSEGTLFPQLQMDW